MAKKRGADSPVAAKSKKQKRKASYLVPSKIDQPTAPVARPSTVDGPRPAVSSIAAARARQAARQVQRPTLVTDYRYVMADLRRIAVVAGVMFVVLIGLSFVIR